MFSLNLIQSPQPNLSTYKKFLMLYDFFPQKFAKTSYLPTKKLLTANRKDIEYRVKFLDDVINKSVPMEQTLYFQFIGDDDKNVIMNAMNVSNDFLKLCDNIKNSEIKEPIAVGYYPNKKIKTRYIFNSKKKWINIKNENNYQVINGAHRLAVAIFLRLDKVPVKIYRSLSFEIPNYTEYLKIKESEYLRNLKKY